jgi:hypothetical protein
LSSSFRQAGASKDYLVKNWVCLPVSKNGCQLHFALIWGWMSSIYQNIEVVSHFQNIMLSSICQHFEVLFNLQTFWDCLPFANLLSLSSIQQNIKVVFHFQNSIVVVDFLLSGLCLEVWSLSGSRECLGSQPGSITCWITGRNGSK